MCKDCLKERMPDRGSTCLEGGAYLLNYAGCSQCHSKGFLGEEGRKRTLSSAEAGEEGEEEDSGKEEEVDEEETIIFKHVCKDCGHVIATHKYTFSVTKCFQDYSMQCSLCGHGNASVSILPDDPREKPFF